MDLSFCVLLGVYVVLGAALTGMARSGIGVGQALSSRYISISSLFWVGTIVLGQVAAQGFGRRVRGLALCAGVCIFLLLGYNARFGWLQWTERYDFRLPARAELISGNNEDMLQRLHPDPKVVLERREILRKHRLSVFR